MAAEWGRYGIRANAIMPGSIATGAGAPRADAPPAAMLARTPLGRLGTSAEVAGAAVFLLSAEASYGTGQNVSVNGGRIWSIAPKSGHRFSAISDATTKTWSRLGVSEITHCALEHRAEKWAPVFGKGRHKKGPRSEETGAFRDNATGRLDGRGVSAR
ncbi:MAG: SDR family oxidoreductase [Sphingomonadales bacterium]|nr:SDR family oxidoreductase [Sphingomonadales bacterium]